MNILLAAVIAYGVVHLGAGLISPIQTAMPVLPPQTPAAIASGQNGGLEATSIVSAHFFGQAGIASTAPRSTTPPETRLNLILKGTVYSTVRENTKAIIATPGGESKSYRRDQSVPGGATLKDIYADHVILSRNGRFETLRLRGKDGNPTSGIKVEQTSVQVDTEKVDRYRQQLLSGDMSLLDLVTMTAVQRNGRQIGYRLHPGQNPGAFREIGLKNNDILTALNGIALDAPANGAQALKLLRESRNFQLELLRNSQPVSLSIDLN